MAENGYGPTPVAGHVGRIPNYGRSHVNPMGNVEPPACIQNAMMTKDKKPFTYTPGGLDLSQIRTPSMARRMARQRSLEEQEQMYGPQQINTNSNYHPQGGPVPPPPPPPQIPPPPPSLVINVPKSKSPKPVVPGERPEIVIPENPIGMLRKTNSPYHWEAEKAELSKLGPVPKFVEKVPSPLTVKMPPSTFSQQPPQAYPSQNQRPIYYGSTPESPIHKPEAQYANHKTTLSNTNASPPTRETLVRQDSQFNKSPQPFSSSSPISNGSPFSPTPNNNWKQPERRDSPAKNSIQTNRGPFSPNAQQFSPSYQNQQSPVTKDSGFYTLPRASQRSQDSQVNNAPNNNIIYNNTNAQSPKTDASNSTPWRTNTLNRHPRDQDNQQQTLFSNQNSSQQQMYNPPWKTNDVNDNQSKNNNSSPWKQENYSTTQQQRQYSPPWTRASQDSNNNKTQYYDNSVSKPQDNNLNGPTQFSTKRNEQPQEQPRYQSTMSIPVTPRKSNLQQENNNGAQKEVVYVNQEPVFYCPDSPKSIPPWVKTQKEKTKTPPPVWCQRPLEGTKSVQRELTTPPKEANQEPEWIKISNDLQRGGREVVSPPKYQQSSPPVWSTRPSDNRKLENNLPNSPTNRIIPIQMQIADNRQGGNQQPQLRLVIDMQQNPNVQANYSQPTQRIMRVLSPQLVRLDDGPSQPDLPTLNRSFQSQDNQSKTRIIPIQIEGDSTNGANKSSRVYYHKFTLEGPPRQSKAFKVLQIITGTQDADYVLGVEEQHGFTDV